MLESLASEDNWLAQGIVSAKRMKGMKNRVWEKISFVISFEKMFLQMFSHIRWIYFNSTESKINFQRNLFKSILSLSNVSVVKILLYNC